MLTCNILLLVAWRQFFMVTRDSLRIFIYWILKMKAEIKIEKLTVEEKAQLRLWSSATPTQRLNWLEEAQQIAYQSGAWQKYVEHKM